jgi:hypothetical protein
MPCIEDASNITQQVSILNFSRKSKKLEQLSSFALLGGISTLYTFLGGVVFFAILPFYPTNGLLPPTSFIQLSTSFSMFLILVLKFGSSFM